MTDWLNLPEKTYDIILADPPWSYYGAQNKWGAAAKFYSTATDEVIATLPIESLLADRGILFLWATSPRLDKAMECLKSWGLHYRGMAFVWVKTRKDGVPIGARGVKPSIVKPTAEYVLAASKIKMGRPMELHSQKVRNVVLAPVRQHSQKPDDVARSIEELYPDAERLEMFARTRRPGWDAWGNETEKFEPVR